MSKKEIYESFADSGIGWVDWIFNKTVALLFLLGEETGLTDKLEEFYYS